MNDFVINLHDEPCAEEFGFSVKLNFERRRSEFLAKLAGALCDLANREGVSRSVLVQSLSALLRSLEECDVRETTYDEDDPSSAMNHYIRLVANDYGLSPAAVRRVVFRSLNTSIPHHNED